MKDLSAAGALRAANERLRDSMPARLAAEAAQRARELEEECRGLEMVNATALKLASNVDQRAIAQAVVADATLLCRAEFGAFFMNALPAEGPAHELCMLAGATREAFANVALLRNSALFEATCTDGAVVRADDIPRDPRYGRVAPHFGASQGSLPVRSYLAVPVRSGTGEAMGGLFFGHAQPGVLTERAERLVRGMAAQAAAALAHARSYQHERRARAEAERASALKDEFLATVSHELRAPLSAIVGWARVIASRPMEAEELARIAGIIDDNAGAQARLIEDLLDVSRIASGTLRLDALSIQPARVIEAAVEALRPVAAQKDIRIAVLLDADAGPVRADPVRVQQVVWNLVSNALEFTPRGGRIQVVLRRAGSHAEIAVADTGIGIEAQFLPHVFDRFGRADDTFRHHPGGLGLGLSIARHLVELHGGTIRAESAGKGCGATFTVCLPLTVAEHPALDAR